MFGIFSEVYFHSLGFPAPLVPSALSYQLLELVVSKGICLIKKKITAIATVLTVGTQDRAQEWHFCSIIQWKRKSHPILTITCAVHRCDKENISRWDTSVNYHSFISVIRFLFKVCLCLEHKLMGT